MRMNDKIKEILKKRGVNPDTLEGLELVADLVELVYDERADAQAEMIEIAKKRYEV